MQKSVLRIRSKLNITPIFIVPALLFVLILTINFSENFLQTFQAYSFIVFLIVIGIYFFTFRLPEKMAWLAGLSFTMVIFALPLLYKWTSGFSDNCLIGGLLPYKDCWNYFRAIQMVLDGDIIKIVANQAADRPLIPGFYSIFMLFTGFNLKWALAIITGLAGFAAYLAARSIFSEWGALPASVFVSLLYIYIQPMLGLTNSEIPGYIFGCFGFVLIWRAAKYLSLLDLVLGLIILMLAITARASAYFVFPMLILWAGWAFRKQKRFSFKIAGIAFITVLFSFLALNIIFSRLVVEPGKIPFEKFVFMLYGQVRGGARWNEGFKVTGTKDSELIFRAAVDFFRRHPLSFFIGSAKSYRDFFFPIYHSIYPFFNDYTGVGVDVFPALGMLVLLISGLFFCIRKIKSSIFAMLLAGFIGVVLSIPFLPPVDGGNRFYASVIPFIYVLPVVPINHFLHREKKSQEQISFGWHTRWLPVFLLSLSVLIPITFHQVFEPERVEAIECPSHQVPFAIKIKTGSYIDLIPDKVESCSSVPAVCLNAYRANGIDKTTDPLFQELELQALSMDETLRVVPYNNLTDGVFHYYYGTVNQLQSDTNKNIIGCATEIPIRSNYIYKVESTQKH